MWWLSTRVIRRAGEPEWADYINFLGLPHLAEVRSIDSWCNPHAEGSGNYALDDLEQLAEILDWLPRPIPGKQYYLLFTDALKQVIPQHHPQLKLLGYDLSDETWTSSLLNCGRWEGILAPIAQNVNQYGLLNWEDALTAQSILPDAWCNTPHAFVTIWALFEMMV
jgi:hypothetical protein